MGHSICKGLDDRGGMVSAVARTSWKQQTLVEWVIGFCRGMRFDHVTQGVAMDKLHHKIELGFHDSTLEDAHNPRMIKLREKPPFSVKS
jgi:hypothetical protein